MNGSIEELITAKKHFSKMGWFYVAAVAALYLVEVPLVFVVSLLRPEWLGDGNITVLLSMIPMYCVAFPLLIFLMKKMVPAVKLEKHKMTAGQYVLSAVICLGLAYASNIFGNILTFLIGAFKGGLVENQIASLAESLHPAMILIYMVICAPVMEEYIFRKLIVDRTVRYGQGTAVVVSGLMFGLFHGNLNQFVYAAVIGMFLAFLYVKTGDLRITISLHMLFNFVGGFLSSLLLRAIDLEGYLAAAEEGDFQSIISYMSEHVAGWVLYGIFLLFVIGMLVTGLVLFIVFAAKRRFALEKGEVTLPRGLRANLVLANSGMLVFGLYWIVQIMLQLME